MEAPWWHVESFLYLSDVDDGNAPTHLVPLDATKDYSTAVPLLWPDNDPEPYAAERPAPGVRGSLLVYRTDVFHRGVDLTEPGAARFLLNVSYKIAGHDWIGFTAIQSRATSQHWVEYAEGSTPASSTSSASRNPATRSGPPSSSTSPPSATPSSTSRPGATR